MKWLYLIVGALIGGALIHAAAYGNNLYAARMLAMAVALLLAERFVMENPA